MRNWLLVPVLSLSFAGCALQPTHHSKVVATIEATNQGRIDQALLSLDEKTSQGDKAELLYNLDKGELLRVDRRYEESQASFAAADAKVNAWEETARTEPKKLLANIMATFMGDGSRTYEGQDYEKVMLSTRMAMNRINLNDLDNARVDIKRTHEREAVIAEFRARETAAAEEEAKKSGVAGSAKELNGYPVETLNDPEVLALKNGYQNALSHYLAGYIYEALNEPGLAAPGYRKAIELRPNVPALEQALAGLDQRTGAARPTGLTDVLFVVEAGMSPARRSVKLNIPIPTTKGLIMAPVTYPVIEPNRQAINLAQITVGDKAYPASLVTDFNVMARRALKDELPGMQLRAAIRTITKATLQAVANQKGGAVGPLMNLLSVVTEPNADDRMWRTLPERVFIARAFIPPGTHALRIPGAAEGATTLAVDGRNMVVPIRLLNARTYVGQAAQFGTVPPVVASAEPQPEPKPVLTAPSAPQPAKSSRPSSPVTRKARVVPGGDAKASAGAGQ